MLRSATRLKARYLSVELDRVRLVLGARSVLRGITWRIEPGQRWVLVGDNGAGKTQLLKLVAGDVWPTPLESREPPALRRYGWQGRHFDEPYGIKAEIAYLGAERQDRYEHYDWNFRVAAVVGTGMQRSDIPQGRLNAVQRRAAARILRRLGIEALAGRRFLSLSYGERRLVLLARAIAWRPKLLLLDELYNGLDPLNRRRAEHFLRSMTESGLPWVLTTHHAEDIPASASHVCELVRGRLVRCGALTRQRRHALTASLHSAPRAASGAALAVIPAVAAAATVAAGAAAVSAAATLIAFERASVWQAGKRALRHITLQIRSGDCWVVHGPNGSGKSTLLRAAYGELGSARGGSIVRVGLAPGVPLQQFQRRVGFVAPELQASQPQYLRAAEVVASGLHASIGLNAAMTGSERTRTLSALRQLGAVRLAERPLRALSYGQLRRVLFARALVHQPDILLLDEPYAGLDARTRAALWARVEQARRRGITIVIAVHHRAEWPSGATHELELENGRAIYCGPARGGSVA